MKPKPLSLTSRLIVPFMGAMLPSPKTYPCDCERALAGLIGRLKGPTPARRPVGAGWTLAGLRTERGHSISRIRRRGAFFSVDGQGHRKRGPADSFIRPGSRG